MFITIAMLIEALAAFELSDIIQKKERLSTIRILTDDQSMVHKILYLSVINKNCTQCLTAKGSSFYVAADIFSVFNHIAAVFDEYNQWKNTLVQKIESGCTLTEILNLSYPLIKHPLAILDASEYEIAHSDLFEKTDVDPEWTKLVQNRTSDSDKIAAFNQQYYKYLKLKQVYHIPGDIFKPGYACNLFHNQTFCGILLMAAPPQMAKVSPGELDVLQYISELICHMLDAHSYNTGIKFPESPLGEYLTNENPKALEMLSRALKIASWKENDMKWLIYAQPLSMNPLTPMPSHAKLMFNRIEGIISVEYKTGLVFLCNLRILKNKDKAIQQLSSNLNEICYYAGTSSSFYELEELMDMTEQAQIALNYAPKANGAIHLFEHAVTPYLISMLKKIDQGRLKHPVLNQLMNYDRRYGSKLYDTLYIYLKNERKIAETLKELKIPRSTLLNRLQRIDQILDISLDSPEERLYLSLSYTLYHKE